MDFSEDLEFWQSLVKLVPYLPKSKYAVQSIAEEIKFGSVKNWVGIRLLLLELGDCNFQHRDYNLSQGRDKFVKFIYRVLMIFVTHKCSDIELIGDTLEFLCCILNGDGDPEEFDRRIPFYKDSYRPIYLPKFETILVTSYKEIQSLIPSPSEAIYERFYSWNVFKSFTLCGESQILKCLISFGATLICQIGNPQDVSLDCRMIYDILIHLYEVTGCFNVEGLTKDFLKNLNENFSERSRKRLFFINVILQTFIKQDFRTSIDEHIQCARLFVKCTPEPLITSQEIKNYITKLTNGIFQDEQLLQFLAKYEKYFPESLACSTPRSLKHLSRFQVRECLRTARSYPHRVQSLCVPKKIKDYILFKDILL